jgi:hypothetical protein
MGKLRAGTIYFYKYRFWTDIIHSGMLANEKAIADVRGNDRVRFKTVRGTLVVAGYK